MSEVQVQNSQFLPHHYNVNRVVLLARDPHCLFAYWEISEDRKQTFINDFGYELWEKSVPTLKVTDVTTNTHFDIRINDFSSSWYISVPDSGHLYIAELGRKVSDHFFIHLASSNYVTTPENKVSTNTASYFINFKTLKNGYLDVENGSIHETYHFKADSQIVLGPSSPEFIRTSLEESMLGVSSAEFYSISLAEHLGISSDIFFR